MPDDNEKVEDFISLWKKKMASENTKPSVIGDTLNEMESLKQENDELRKKIAQNIDLISRSEEIIRRTVEEKEKLKVDKEEAILEVNISLKDLEQENLELGNKVKNMVKLLLEKDEEIKELSLKPPSGSLNETQPLLESLKSELSKKAFQITDLEFKISELTSENEALHGQLVEKMKSLPIDYVVPVESTEPKTIKPKPPETSSQPLEQLCQDLQSDLNKYKRMIEKLTSEKSQLKAALENKGIKFDESEISSLREENEVLKRDLMDLEKSLSKETRGVPQDSLSRISELEGKLREKEDMITQLKLTQSPQVTNNEPMSALVEELQKSINKLKTAIREKDQKIEELQRATKP